MTTTETRVQQPALLAEALPTWWRFFSRMTGYTPDRRRDAQFRDDVAEIAAEKRLPADALAAECRRAYYYYEEWRERRKYRDPRRFLINWLSRMDPWPEPSPERSYLSMTLEEQLRADGAL